MPRKANAVELGTMRCPSTGCGATASVYQNTRGYLYTRCPECGADQRNGKPAQVYFWQHVEPKAGAVIDRPPNVPEGAGPIGGSVSGEAPAVVVDDAARPAADPAPEPEVQEPVEPKGAAENESEGESGKGGVLLLAGFFGLMVAGVTKLAMG